ncbi:MAG: Dabb family protein [Thermomicrobiales bacterium]
MIRHVVLIQPNSQATDDALQSLGEQIERLAGRMCGDGAYVIGPNTTEEPLAQGYLFGFTMDFPDRQALATYHADPEHAEVASSIKALAASVLVFDFNV